ncbi:STAS domain-containing protein [Streptomyces sp. NPDC051207]|uniref:STAS domain-containing protein n=1 Tax=Streptomyces sp. NPDC051207 TaxID=3154641 RepID=UPI00343F19AF
MRPRTCWRYTPSAARRQLPADHDRRARPPHRRPPHRGTPAGPACRGPHHPARLSGVSFLDSTGLTRLLIASRAARSAGGHFLLIAPSPPVRHMLEITLHRPGHPQPSRPRCRSGTGTGRRGERAAGATGMRARCSYDRPSWSAAVAPDAAAHRLMRQAPHVPGATRSPPATGRLRGDASISASADGRGGCVFGGARSRRSAVGAGRLEVV